MTELGFISHLLHAGQGWDVTFWDGVGSGGRWCLWFPARLPSRHCSSFSSFTLLVFSSFFEQNGAPHMVKALEHDDTPIINPWFQIFPECSFCADPFSKRPPQIPLLVLWSHSDLQRQDVWVYWAGWSCYTWELSSFSLGEVNGTTLCIHSLP